MSKFSSSKGFTLIELLVVIAILGILAAVVLIAINPAERIKESQDTQVRSDVSTVVSAVEACFTNKADGTYNACNTTAELVAGGFLKNAPQTAIQWSNNSGFTEVRAYAPLEAASARDDKNASGAANTCTASPVYYVYDSTSGKSFVQCTAPGATF